MWDFEFIPPQVSDVAAEVDAVFFTLLGLTVFFSVGVASLILYFLVKYRHGSTADRTHALSGNTRLEVTWMVVPLFMALGMFAWASVRYFEIKSPPPEEPLEIFVVAKQWMWKFQHPTGPREINTLHVPRGEVVKLMMTSQDVIHSFFVPAFRVKQDVLPGRYTNMWFRAEKTGTYNLFCAEYCGTSHSKMGGTVHVMEPAAYEQWLREGATGGSDTEPGTGRFGRAPTGTVDEPESAGPWGRTLPEDEDDAGQSAVATAGAQLFRELRCTSCHRPDSSSLYPAQGPSLYNLYGQEVELRNQRKVIADEDYLRESILYPQTKLVLGYPAIMPTFKGQITEEELMQLVVYIKTLGPGRVPDGDLPAAPQTSPPEEESETPSTD